MKVTKERIVELLEIEHECMLRASHGDCARKCEDCTLCQNDDELHEMYTDVIQLLKNRPLDVLKSLENMEKMRIENAELLQHIHRLEEELGKERAYLKALVTIVNNADFHT